MDSTFFVGELSSAAVFYLLALLAAAAMGSARSRRALGLAIAATTLAIPFLFETQFLRVMFAILALAALLRTIELVGRVEPPSFPRRAWHIVGVIDTFRAQRSSPSFSRQLLGRVALFAGGMVIGVGLLELSVDRSEAIIRSALRWLGGLVLLYSGVELVMATMELVYRVVGIVPLPSHHDPILSRSIAEFWSRRWNRIVHRFLKRWVFVPAARVAGSWAGTAATFIISSLLHFYLASVFLPVFLASSMASFFIVQIPLLWIEDRIGVLRWRPPLGRAWTLAAMLLPSPLFIEPVVVAVGF